MHNVFLLILGCAVSALAACGASSAAESSPAPSNGTPDTATWLAVTPVAEEPFEPSVDAPARFELRDDAVVDVTSAVEGRVVALYVLPGDVVEAGAPLAAIESPNATSLRAELGVAEAEVAAAQRAVRRQQRMQADGVGIEAERAEAEVRVAQARIRLLQAQRDVARLGEGVGSEVIVRASVGGTVLERLTARGAMVGSEPLFRIGDPDRVWIVAQVLDRDVPTIVRDGRAVVRTAGGVSIDARVVRVGSVVDASTRRASVYLEPDVKARGLRAGTWARAELFGTSRAGIVLPIEAVLLKERGKAVVYVETADGYAPRDVEVGTRLGDKVEIKDGVAVGDRVVRKNALLLDAKSSIVL